MVHVNLIIMRLYCYECWIEIWTALHLIYLLKQFNKH